MTIQTQLSRTVDHHHVDEPITVEFKYYSGCRGARDSLGGIRGAGPPLEPDDPPEIEILKTFNTETGHEVELSSKEYDLVLEECWDALREAGPDE